MNATSQDVARAQAVLTDAPVLAEALCITAVNLEADVALARYGGAWLGESLTIEDALELETLAYPRYLRLAVSLARPPWTLVIEPSGTQGTQPQTLQTLSDRASAVNLFWNINLRARCRYWRQQVELASFELLDTQPGILADPWLQQLRRGLTFDDPDLFKAEALVLLERITGVALDWTSASHPAAVVIAADHFTLADPQWLLSTRAPDLHDTDPVRLDTLAAQAVDLTLRTAGVDPRSLQDRPDTLLAEARELAGQHMVSFAHSLRTGGPTQDTYLRQAHAIAAARARLANDATERTAGALVHAIDATPGGWPPLRQALDHTQGAG